MSDLTYDDGSQVQLGDLVTVTLPDGRFPARVVMLGNAATHLNVDARFLEWVRSAEILKPHQVVVEWLGTNPFAHNNSTYAPVGNYMFTSIDEDITLDARA
jgi:hypothetical protein